VAARTAGFVFGGRRLKGGSCGLANTLAIKMATTVVTITPNARYV